MSTILQKRLASTIAKNAKAKKPLNKRDLLVSAGYDETTAKASPERTIMQKGVQKELKHLGFSEEGAKKVVEEILYKDTAEYDTRLKAADMVFKVHGTYAPEKKINANVDINELQKAIAKQIQSFRMAK